MALKRPTWPAGRVVTLEHTSKVLADNPLGDPHVRTLDVWLPPQYDQAKGRGRGARFPWCSTSSSFTNTGRSHTAWRNFDENVPERAARLIHERKLGPVILVFPDCFTAFGGNQYVNSSAVGRYADYLTRELIPFVDRELRTHADREHRGVLRQVVGRLRRADSRDEIRALLGCGREPLGRLRVSTSSTAPEWPSTLDELARHRLPQRVPGEHDVRAAALAAGDDGADDGRIARFLAHVWEKRQPSGAEIQALTSLAMAATYDPDPKAPNGFRVPYNLETGERLPQRWRRWLRHDPVKLVARYARQPAHVARSFHRLRLARSIPDSLRRRRLSLRLTEQRVPHVYEEFDGTHSGVDYRMERSLPFLARALR